MYDVLDTLLYLTFHYGSRRSWIDKAMKSGENDTRGYLSAELAHRNGE